MNEILFTANVRIYSGNKTILSNTKTLSPNKRVFRTKQKFLAFGRLCDAPHRSAFILFQFQFQIQFICKVVFFSRHRTICLFLCVFFCRCSFAYTLPADRCSIVCAMKSKLNAAPSFILAFFYLFVFFFLLLFFLMATATVVDDDAGATTSVLAVFQTKNVCVFVRNTKSEVQINDL